MSKRAGTLMEYLITFIEGIITFISPCLLPMLPLYLLYFAANKSDDVKKRVWINAVAFIIGFTFVFTLMGAFAGSIGSLLQRYQTYVNIVTGIIVIVLGLSFIGVIKLNIFGHSKFKLSENKPHGFFSTLIFGMVFALGWTPCIGAFLGSALLLASQHGSVIKGMILLLLYSLGLGIPFLISAILIDSLKNTFDFIKKNYHVINMISGISLILIGIAMMFGLLGKLLTILSF